MQSQNQLFDDLVKMINGAAGTLAGVGREAQAGAQVRAREWFGGLDFVGRDEFEAVKSMAAAARDEADALRARLDRLEESASPTPPAAAPAPVATPVADPAAGTEPIIASLEPAPTIDEVDG